MSVDLEELRRLAEAATPGNWVISSGEDENSRKPIECGYGRSSNGIASDNGEVVIIADPSEGEYSAALDLGSTDATYIVAANPQTVLALLDRISVLESENEGHSQKPWHLSDIQREALIRIEVENVRAAEEFENRVLNLKRLIEKNHKFDWPYTSAFDDGGVAYHEAQRRIEAEKICLHKNKASIDKDALGNLFQCIDCKKKL